MTQEDSQITNNQISDRSYVKNKVDRCDLGTLGNVKKVHCLQLDL